MFPALSEAIFSRRRGRCASGNGVLGTRDGFFVGPGVGVVEGDKAALVPGVDVFGWVKRSGRLGTTKTRSFVGTGLFNMTGFERSRLPSSTQVDTNVNGSMGNGVSNDVRQDLLE